MSFAISEVLEPTSVTAAELIPSFSPNGDVLAAARGNRLYLYPIEGEILGTPKIVTLYGTIFKVIPLKTSMVSNILVILTDLRSCILNCDDDGNINTISSGNLTPSPPCLPLDEIKYAVIPSALVIKFHSNDLTVIPINSESELGTPFPITLSCKSIVDFVFIGPISRVTRLAVLTNEFHDSPKLHLFEIDLTNNVGTEDINQTVSLPEDTYMIFPYLPETHSVVMSFSSVKAISVTYASGLPPKPSSFTIFTPNKLPWLAQMKENFYAFIDDVGTVRVSEISEDNTLRFTDIGKTSIPSAVVAVTESLLFVAAKSGPASLYEVHHTKLEKKMIIDSADSVREFTGNHILFNCAIARMDRVIKVRPSFVLQMKNMTNVWANGTPDNDYFVLSTPQNTFFLQGMDGVYEDSTGDRITDEPTILFSFEPSVHVTPTRASFGDDIKAGEFTCAACSSSSVVLVSPQEAVLYSLDHTVLHKFEGSFIAAAMSDNLLALATINTLRVFNTEYEEITSVGLISPVASIAIHRGNIYAAHSFGYVTIISGGRAHTVKCDGFHSSARVINDKVVVFGEIPVCFDGSEMMLYGQPRTLDGCFLNGSTVSVMRDGLSFGIEQGVSTTVATFNDDKMPLTIREIKGGFVMAYGDSLYTCGDLQSPKHLVQKFETDIVGIESFDDVLIVLTKRTVYLMAVDSPTSVYAGPAHKNHQDAVCCGIYNDQLYIMYAYSVKFYHIERSMNGVDLIDSGTQRLDNPQRFVAVATGSGVFALADEDGKVRIFGGAQMKEIACSATSYRITKLGILGEHIIAGTQCGEIVAITAINDAAKQIRIEAASSLALGNAVTAISPERSGTVLVGLSSGQVFSVRQMSHPRNFAPVYEALENRVYSLGHFNKVLERSIWFKRFIIRAERFVDLDLIKDFIALSPDAQETVLEVSQICREDALATLSLYA